MTGDIKPIWRYIPLEEYSRTTEPASEVARTGLRTIWRRLRHTLPAERVNVQAELRSAPQKLLNCVVPEPSWDDSVEAVGSALQNWLDSENSFQAVIGAPGSGTRQVLMGLAEKRGWAVIESPSIDLILKGGDEWLSHVKESKSAVVVLPCLEACYLRHHDGLILMRKLTDWLLGGSCRFLIGCSSWAWAYLSKTLQMDAIFPSPIVLEAFDGWRLQQWFRSLAMAPRRRPLVFRQSDNGNVILLSEESQSNKENGDSDKSAEVPDFLNRVAGRSRGIPLVAWAIWRNTLQIAAGEDIDKDAIEAAASDRGLTIWVRPWAHMELPSVPVNTSRDELFLLHLLLLHDGLTAQSIPHLLPCAAAGIMQGMDRLRTAGLVKIEDGIWRVTLLGYPAVRQYLYDEDYLVDVL